MLTGKTINELPLGIPTPNSVYPFYDNGVTYKEIKPGVYTSLITMTGGTILSPTVMSNTLGFEPEWVKVSSILSGFNFPTMVDYDKIFYTITPKLDLRATSNMEQVSIEGGCEFILGGYIPNKIDETFNIGSGFLFTEINVKPSVNVITPFENGFLVGGYFNLYSGITSESMIYLNNDGSINQSFISGFNGYVNSIVIQPDDKILVGGDFSTYSGQNYNSIVRLNTDGSIDETFNVGDGFNSTVFVITVQSDNKILVGGYFNLYSGQNYNSIVRLNTDGSIDETFNVGDGFNREVHSIVIQPDDKILVGGDFSTYSGQNYNSIVRLNTDGSIDETFVIGNGFILYSEIIIGNALVSKITINPSDGKILVVGNFTSYNDISCNKIIKLNLDGSIDEAFTTDYEFRYLLKTITIQNDGKILVGGTNTVNRLNSNGSIDETFNVTLVGLQGGFALSFTSNPLQSVPHEPSLCSDIAIQSDGKIILSGQFSSVNEINKNNICRIENSSDGVIDFQIKLLNGQEFTKVPFEIRNYTPIPLNYPVLDSKLGRIHIPDSRDHNYLIENKLSLSKATITSKNWDDNVWWGDQGQTPMCVGYAWAHWIEDGPVLHNSKTHPVVSPVTIYKEAQKVDEWVGENYDGTSVRGGAKYLKTTNRISSYLWTFDINVMINTVLTVGPVVVGTNWYTNMFYPDRNGLIKIGGNIAGGHAYEINGVDTVKQLFRIKNSWGRSWGQQGRVYISFADMKRLINENGEVCLAVENRF